MVETCPTQAINMSDTMLGRCFVRSHGHGKEVVHTCLSHSLHSTRTTREGRDTLTLQQWLYCKHNRDESTQQNWKYDKVETRIRKPVAISDRFKVSKGPSCCVWFIQLVHDYTLHYIITNTERKGERSSERRRVRERWNEDCETEEKGCQGARGVRQGPIVLLPWVGGPPIVIVIHYCTYFSSLFLFISLSLFLLYCLFVVRFLLVICCASECVYIVLYMIVHFAWSFWMYTYHVYDHILNISKNN